MSAISNIAVASKCDFADVLKSNSIFQGLPAPVMELVYMSSDHRLYEAGDSILSMGSFDASEFFVIASGRARVSFVDPGTGAIVVEDLEEGSVFGLELILAEGLADAFKGLSVTAEDHLEVIAIDAESFRELTTQRPSLMRNVAMFLARELSSVRLNIAPAQAAPLQRVYAALLLFIERDATTGQWCIPKMPKHRELAEQAGVEEALTADAVAALIQDGVAQRDYPGMIIKNLNRLNELAG